MCKISVSKIYYFLAFPSLHVIYCLNKDIYLKEIYLSFYMPYLITPGPILFVYIIIFVPVTDTIYMLGFQMFG